ncbi:spore germination protein [Paenibacillus cremeus]|uniref:Spore germination protein n=1 Tax=Paenibacillus cremeus TaxID=2163881 RepID=A0A559KDG3_9BACL|nr:spore germination protein [Paenibacillus cremeus]TVY10144.1 spore germination protein [Paenibacillus cremeus]
MNTLALSEMNEQSFRDWFAMSADVQIRTYDFGTPSYPIPLVLMYCEGMADLSVINELVLTQLQHMLDSFDEIKPELLNKYRTLQLEQITTPDPLVTLQHRLYSGELIIFFEEHKWIFSLDISRPPERGPEESSTEVSIKGPRDGFTENLTTNIALIRKRLKTKSLCIEKFVIGERTQTSVGLIYISDIANPEIIVEAKSWLTAIKADALLTSAQLEIPSTSLFPLFDSVGRPDYVVQSLLRGRFAVLVEGTPMAVIAPANLLLILKSPEDVHLPFFYVSIERLLRLLGLILALFLPGFWIAVSSYNLDQIPFPLLATISSSRLGLPFSGTVDFFLILALFEMFREAGLRLPKPVGQTVAVVGGLIIGDAAIRAGITGPITLVTTAISTISMFTLVNQSLAGTITLFRLLILIASSMFGMFGFMLAVVSLVLYLSTLESFGVSYLAPLSPPKFRNIAAAVLALPWKKLKRRPAFLHPTDPTRQGGDAS